MILDGKTLKIVPFKDSRGHSGGSGQLHIAEDSQGTQYLVKSKPVDVVNEYVAHRLGTIIGVPTSDAVLIKNNGSVEVGIVYEKDFKRANADQFIGPEHYPDDSPYLADLMAYFAFRNMIVIEDNIQLAFAGNRLISFDYAESFYLTDYTLAMLKNTGNISHPVALFNNHLFLDSGYRTAIRIMKRPDSEYLLDAYLDPLFNFQDADLKPILDDLDSVFPKPVSAFYRACFDSIGSGISDLSK